MHVQNNDYLVMGAMKCKKERPLQYYIKLNTPFTIQLKGNLNPISFKTWHFQCDVECEPV